MDQLHSIVLNLSQHTHGFNHEDGEILAINKIFTKLTGYTLKDIPTIRDWTIKAYGYEMNLVADYVNRLYKGEETVHDGEYQIRTAQGQERIWDFSTSAMGSYM